MTKNCLTCEKPFKANHGKQKFCSDKCKMSYNRELKKNTEKMLARIQSTPIQIMHSQTVQTNNEWALKIEEYCTNQGLTPEDLISFHTRWAGKLPKIAPKTNYENILPIISVTNLNEHPSSNYAVNTKPRSTRLDEMLKKKRGF